MKKKIKHPLPWWIDQWLLPLHAYDLGSREKPGLGLSRKLTRDNFIFQPGIIEVQVPHKKEVFEVKIHLSPWLDRDWKKAIPILTRQASHISRLLAGEVPPTLLEELDKKRLSVFPLVKEKFAFQCTCQSRNLPCQHIIGAYYGAAKMADSDPFILFQLKGRSREGILPSPPKKSPHLEEKPLETSPPGPGNLSDFWQDREFPLLQVAPPSGLPSRLEKLPFKVHGKPLSHWLELIYQEVEKGTKP